ncbi:MAG: CCA tRNA nucleotidyltransferase [Planctomycetaceae bacterium]|nr:CCA tRNA nucleotidyltransferase [Planctomycetaceae bacterium]
MTDRARNFATEVVTRLRQAGYEALWAGGCVRDLLLGKTPKDYDVATSAHPEQVREVFGRRRTLGIGASFGVILVRGPAPGLEVEVATFRTEGPYLDGRRPEQVTFATAAEDAHRRDFTINGMFLDPVSNQVHDYVEGQHDLAAGIIRAIGNPRARVEEDRLRMLRAVRFTATLDFQLEPETAAAIRELATGIHLVSAERITQEMKRVLTDPHRARGVALCAEMRLLQEILPELTEFADLPESVSPLEELNQPGKEDSPWHIVLRRLSLLEQPGFELAFASLLLPHSLDDQALPPDQLHDIRQITAICRRWKLSNDEKEHIGWLLAHRHVLHAGVKLPLSQLKRMAIRPAFQDLIELTRVDRLVRNLDLSPVLAVEQFVEATPPEELNPPPLLDGSDLIALGHRPGPQFSSWLTAIRDAQLEGQITTVQEARDLLARLHDDDSASG